MKVGLLLFSWFLANSFCLLIQRINSRCIDIDPINAQQFFEPCIEFLAALKNGIPFTITHSFSPSILDSL